MDMSARTWTIEQLYDVSNRETMFLHLIDRIGTHISRSDLSGTTKGRCGRLFQTLICASWAFWASQPRPDVTSYSSSRWMDAWPSYAQLDRHAFGKIVINTCIHADIVYNRRPTTLRDACSSSRIPGGRHGIGTWRDNFADVRWGCWSWTPAARRMDPQCLC
jgi:hypothetical protein